MTRGLLAFELVAPLDRAAVVEAAGWALVHFVWQGAVVAAVLATVLAVARRASAATRYAASVAALAAMAAVPVGTFAVLLARRPVPAPAPHVEPSGVAGIAGRAAAGGGGREPSAVDAGTGAVVVQRLPAAFSPAGSRAGTPAPRPVAVRSAGPAADPPASTGERVRPALPWLVAAWLVGASILSVRLAGGWARLRSVRRGAAAPPGDWADRFARLAGRVGATRTARLLVAAAGEVPCVIGWVRPVVLVPAAVLAGLPPAYLEAILSHELAHVRRRDYLVNLLQCGAEALLFYHPAVWWASARVRQEREHCCDDAAAAACGDRRLYARALAALEEHRATLDSGGTGGARGDSRLAVAAAGGGPLLPRIRRLASPAGPTAGRAAGWPAGVLALAAVLAVGLTATRGEPAAPGVPPPSTAPAALAPAGTRPTTGPAAAAANVWERLTGRVLTTDGTPAAGATVTAYAWVRGGSIRRAGTATTGADGRFDLPAVEPPGTLVAERADSPRAAVAIRTAGGPLPDVRLPRPAELRVTFLGPDGKPVAGLPVRLRSPIDFGGSLAAAPPDVLGRRTGQTDARGEVRLDRLPLGERVAIEVTDERFARENRVATRFTLARPVTTADPVRVWPPGSIAGRVVGADGRPAAGLQIDAWHKADGTRYDDATADADGAYRLRRLPPGTYDLRVWRRPETGRGRPELVVTKRGVELAAGQDSADQDVTAVPAPAGADGQGAAGATTRPGAGTRSEATTRPGVAPNPGTRRGAAEGDGPGAGVAPSAEPHPASALAAPAAPTAADRGAVTGQVLDEDGRPVARATVELFPLPAAATSPTTAPLPTTAPAAAGGQRSAGSRGRAGTGADGRFTIAGVAAGREYLLRAVEPSRRAATVEAVRVSAGSDVIVRVRRNAWATLAGRVTDAAGHPLAGVHVSTTPEVRPGVLSLQGGTHGEDGPTDADGRFALSAPHPDLRYGLVATLPGGYAAGRAEPVDLSAGATREVPDVVLRKATGVAAGRVVDADGKPAAGVRVSARGAFDRLQAVTDAAGRFRVDAVGDPTVELSAGDGPAGFARVRVKAGTEDAVLTLRRAAATTRPAAAAS